ncbi:hypothetical protein [Flavihumibacter petaseus]|uniref:N-acetyltransferase domain-containing protein n=1 Tax=Flavihumibacter petaseus NBRC 106054 TaxID=1220578 RepID=A0A0E9N445_9BACT|nr:hypothetical protein [Flavihumibacter petaseus]GAO44426.1 hypothetical protein FPE01S_03_04640 [Flavihumibacter petaseus NBRC 106054]
MKLLERSTGSQLDAVIERVTDKELSQVYKDRKRFPCFDWRKYKGQVVYKIRLVSSTEILGLMCIADHPGNNAIEIELLEAAHEHRGREKLMDWIAGCLIAFACRESFKMGYDGVVFLIPKTKLIEHYQKYGFIHIPFRTINRPDGFMVMEQQQSDHIIHEFLE